MNQHYTFWVAYYENWIMQKREAGLMTDAPNRTLTQQKWRPSSRRIPVLEPEHTLYLKTTYPGLLAGLGLAHNSGMAAKEDQDKKTHTQTEIQMGFSLDPVTGLPFVPGSTVKGILRSAFVQSTEYAAMQIRALSGLGDLALTPEVVQGLEIECFGAPHPYAEGEYTADTRTPGTDVFFDAYPVEAAHGGFLMGLDYITPHRADDPAYEGMTEPNPNAMLKVLPDVVFQFRFVLHDSKVIPELTASEKMHLFKNILLDFGAGAKTNTGYGALVPARVERGGSACYLEPDEQGGGGEKPDKPKPSEYDISEQIEAGNNLMAYVKSVDPKKKTAEVLLNPPKFYPIQRPKKEELAVVSRADGVLEGTRIIVQITKVGSKKKPHEAKLVARLGDGR